MFPCPCGSDLSRGVSGSLRSASVKLFFLLRHPLRRLLPEVERERKRERKREIKSQVLEQAGMPACPHRLFYHAPKAPYPVRGLFISNEGVRAGIGPRSGHKASPPQGVVTTDSRVGDVGGACPLAGVNNHVMLVGMFSLRWCFVVLLVLVAKIVQCSLISAVRVQWLSGGKWGLDREAGYFSGMRDGGPLRRGQWKAKVLIRCRARKRPKLTPLPPERRGLYTHGGIGPLGRWLFAMRSTCPAQSSVRLAT